MGRLRAEGWIVLGAAVVASALVLLSSARVPGPPREMALPSAGELAQMERYLEPVEPAVGTQVGVPGRVELEGNPFGRVVIPTAGAPERPAGEPAPRWLVSAIVIAGERRVAIVNDELVRPGTVLDDGARVAAVEENHVVLITPDGQRRRLELQR